MPCPHPNCRHGCSTLNLIQQGNLIANKLYEYKKNISKKKDKPNELLEAKYETSFNRYLILDFNKVNLLDSFASYLILNFNSEDAYKVFLKKI